MERKDINAFKIYEIAKDYFGEEHVDSNICEVTKDTKRDYNAHPVQCNIVIWFPTVTVSNEHNKSVVIYDLFVKMELGTHGRMLDEGFKMMKTTYTKTQWMAGYAHSHLPRVGTTPVWQEPCFGNGPISYTIHLLSMDYDLDRWGLLMFEIEKFVKTESLKGGPYIRLESIGAGTYHYDPITPSSSDLATEFDRKLALEVIRSGELKFGFTGISWSIGNPPIEAALKITKIVLQAIKEGKITGWTPQDMVEQGILIPAVLKDGVLTSLSLSRAINPRNDMLLIFKGRRIPLAIKEDGDTLHYFYVLESTYVHNIINIIICLINTSYGKERKIGTKGKLYIL